jgi:outer membrane exchange protein TraA
MGSMRVHLFLCVILSSRVALAASVTVTGDPVAAVPAVAGGGFCQVAAVSTNPATDFPQAASAFSGGMNAFVDANPASWMSGRLTTPFDLSNNQPMAAGDFTAASCSGGGCPFPYNDTTTSFGMRFRGYVAVDASLVGQPLHFGLYTDDAASVTIFDQTETAYPVLTDPAVLGYPKWRATNTVTFAKAGLYPIEVLYAQVSQDAALEVSTLNAPFSDFDQPANQAPITPLNGAGFQLLAADLVYDSASGGATGCQQCLRADAGAAGNGGCGAGVRCNEAALCEPCSTAAHCGASCAPCGAASACVPLSSSADGGSMYACSQLADHSLDATTRADARALGGDVGPGPTPASGCGCTVGGGDQRAPLAATSALVVLVVFVGARARARALRRTRRRAAASRRA